MASKSYFEKLRDPRWQRRRLEILNRSNFKCEECEADHLTLNVHHRLYRKGADPWEYADHELQALCEECHEALHSLDQILREALSRLSSNELEQALGYVRGLEARRQIEPSDIETGTQSISHLAYEVGSESYCAGFFDALWIDYVNSILDEAILQSPFTGDQLWSMHVDHTVARVRRLRAAGKIKAL